MTSNFTWWVRDSDTCSGHFQSFLSSHISGYMPCSNVFKNITSAPWRSYDWPWVTVYFTSHTSVFFSDMDHVPRNLFGLSADTPGISFHCLNFFINLWTNIVFYFVSRICFLDYLSEFAYLDYLGICFRYAFDQDGILVFKCDPI